MSKRKADEMGMGAPPPEQPQRPQPQPPGAAVTVAAAGHADGAVRNEQSAALCLGAPTATESDAAGGDAEGETDGGGQCAAANCGEPAAATSAAAASAACAACAAAPAVAVGDGRTAADHPSAAAGHSGAGDHRAAADPHGAAAAVTVAAAVSPFGRLAAVELQLVMRCCDQSTLIALARCSRFALAAASHPFVWQPLSPIALQCDWPLQLSGRLRAEHSLLRHADISDTWRLRSKAVVSADQAAALVALPRLRGLEVQSAYDTPEDSSIYLRDAGMVRLLKALGAQIDNGGALTSLSLNCEQLHRAGVRALVTFIERSRRSRSHMLAFRTQ